LNSFLLTIFMSLGDRKAGDPRNTAA